MVTWLLRWVRCTRYNHALEHATLHVLQRRFPQARVLGISDGRGITLYTPLSAEYILPALYEARDALREGATGLAVHPNCGTNLVSSAMLAVLATWLSMALTSRRGWGERFLNATVLTCGALLLGPNLGSHLQARVTTDANLPPVQISSLFADAWGKQNRIRVNLRYEL